MNRNRWGTLILLTSAAAVASCSGDDLGSARGIITGQLCDRGDTCGCSPLVSEEPLDFGSPEPNQTSRRILTIGNENFRSLIIQNIELTDAAGVFTLGPLQWRASDAADAEVRTHDLSQGPLQLSGTEQATLVIDFTPTASGPTSALLTVVSNSSTRPRWEIPLQSGEGSSSVCVPSGDCGEGNTLAFGQFNDGDVAFDASAGLPAALGSQAITVTNSGTSEMFVNVELTDDGIPETRPNELPGESGVFFIGETGCRVIPPGESLTIPIEYRPFAAGQHFGEVSIGGGAVPIRVQLEGAVVGPHICFRTEDAAPNDSTLQFGDPPIFATPTNAPETRRVFVGNCGFQEELEITQLQFSMASSTEFMSASIPWTPPAPIAVGAEVEVPVEFAPMGVVGAIREGILEFTSNDTLRPLAFVRTQGGVGERERCILVASPNPVDFGWVATDDEGFGSSCPPPPFPCVGGSDEKISRRRSFQLTNVGQRDCEDIDFGSVSFDPVSTDMFYVDDVLPSNFTLAPGQSSASFDVVFVKDFDEDELPETPHRGKIPYTSPSMDISPIDILFDARSGGDPNCVLEYLPTQPPGLFCPNESVAFGNVNVGQSRTLDLKVTNNGADSCTINSMVVSGGAGVFSVQQPTLPLNIPVGGEEIVPLTFQPVPPSGNDPFEELPFGCGFANPFGGSGGSALVINYYSGMNSGTILTDELSLSGKGTRPDIDVIPGEVDFGEVTVGCCSAERRVAIYNSGDGPLTINNLAVGAGSDTGFSATAPGLTVIEPGQNTEFTTRFCATGEGTFSGVLEIQSTDDNEEFFTVAVSATGTLDSNGNDAFQQPERPQVDVLWVVDDSGSMGDEQQNLANNFDSFIDTAVSLETEYHLGVILTDVESSQAGQLYSCGGPKFITWTQPTAQQRSQFQCNVRTSDSGRPSSDSKEAPLQAARIALDYPNLDGFNDGFLREEATLYLILVTDEEDQSDGSYQLYVDYFRNLKGVANTDLLNISAIAGPPPDGCATAAGNQVDFDAVNDVGGEFRSICSSDWSDLINSLGLDVFNARRQFPLARPATASTIDVQVCDDDGAGNPVNCMSVPQNPNDGWTFDPNVNAITFNGSAVPDRSQHIQVGYVAICF